MQTRQQQLFSDYEQVKVSEKLIGRTLPAALSAEKSVLGALLLSDEQLEAVREQVSGVDFYYKAHRLLFQVMCDLSDSGKRVDLITVQDELAKRGELDAVGGAVFLVSLQEDLPSLGLVVQHAQIIKEKSVLRNLITSASAIINQCYERGDSELAGVLDAAEQAIFALSAQRVQHNFVQLNLWLKKTFQHLSSLRSHHKGITGVASGYRKLDAMTSGFQKGDFIVIAGRPSMGKTAFALSLAAQMVKEGAGLGFLSLEMAAEQLTLRLLSTQSGIPHHSIRNATLSSDEWMSLTEVAAVLAEQKFFIDDAPMQTIMDIRTKARKLVLEHKAQVLVIDYLQLIHGAHRYDSRHQEVSDISRALKALAKELQIPVIALAQLSRAVDSRVDKRPMLSDLRESGAIEQDADVILFLYRDVVYNPDTEDPALAEVIIGKQRNGPTGTVYLHFNRELTLFEDME
jgi:replicative DNA helicase